MNASPVNIERFGPELKANPKRVICQPFNMTATAVKRIASRLAAFEEDTLEKTFRQVLARYQSRHPRFDALLSRHYAMVQELVPKELALSATAKKLLATYFTKEYAIEAAALFNPSIVPFGNQSGERTFVMSLRATGEGHISSVEFVTGTLDEKGDLRLDPISTYAVTATEADQTGMHEDVREIQFEPDTSLSQRVIFPLSEEESNGIEDLRLVPFNDNGQWIYYGTYTAYDGHKITSKLLETTDFQTFRLHTLHGKAVQDKGMALFPEKINGYYTMISRQDTENLRIMYSKDILHWDESRVIMEPSTTWELTKSGNCGSPLKTEQGWLLLTHGVGPMRQYEIGAVLLDPDDPSKIKARLRESLLKPNDAEREGYVPNVVYSCGGIIHNDWLILPYAMSDIASGFARIKLNDLLQAME